MEKRDTSSDPGWNDPPLFSYEEHTAQLKSTKPKTLLNKRVSYPVDGTRTDNPLVVDPTLPLQPCTKDTLPPPPTTANFLNKDTISAVPNSCKPEEKSKDDEDFNTEDALSQTVANFNSVLTCDSIKNKSDIERRLEIIQKMWREEKFSTEIQKKILQLSEAVKENDSGKADHLQKSLMVDHPSLCSTWMSGIRRLIHRGEMDEQTSTSQDNEETPTPQS